MPNTYLHNNSTAEQACTRILYGIYLVCYMIQPEWLEPVLWPRTWLCELMWVNVRTTTTTTIGGLPGLISAGCKMSRWRCTLTELCLCDGLARHFAWPHIESTSQTYTWYIYYICFLFSHFYFPASGQAVVARVVPSNTRFLPSIFIAHRVQQSIPLLLDLSSSVPNSRSRAFRKSICAW